MRPYLFLVPLIFSLGFLAGYQWATFSILLLESLPASPSTEDLPLILIKILRASSVVMASLQEAVGFLLWANLALISLLIPLLSITVAIVLITVGTLVKMELWDLDLLSRKYKYFQNGLKIIIYGEHHD